MDDLLDIYERHVSRSGARLARMMAAPVLDRAEGSHVYTTSGERFLSCGGFAVFLLGHQFPEVVDPVTEQLRRFALSGPTVLHEGQALAAQALADICPEGLRYTFFLGSGTEATELALKLARLNGKRRLVAARGGYHGKTIGALSVTGREAFREPFAPLLPDVTFVPFGDLDALDAALGPDVCVILEPVQGEGGVRVPPPGYLAAVSRRCAETGALLVLDEIQTGLGRVGELWGATAEGVCPDILLTGKALGGGVVPVSAVVATEAVFEPLSKDPVLHTTTNGGSPLACAAVRATIDAVLRHDVPAKARALGERLQPMLREVFEQRCPHLVREVRGRGLLIGVEFAEPSQAADLVLELLDRNVLVSNTLNSQATVRLTPPVFLTEDDIGWLRSAVDEAATALAAQYPGRS